ncbi:MAG: phenylacetate--CoA ligase family protein [Cyclobacteriaceae bacterium]|nr:phenylacetate--CoA ligase family protein [Cyclobacteriaceae bacterium]
MNGKDEGYVEQKIQERLERILYHAHTTTKFYSGFDVLKGIQSFPVINKNLIRENTDAFLSSKYNESSRIPAITSGSTGTPFKTYQNKDKKNRNTADTLFFASLAGYDLGTKLLYFKIWSDYNRKSSFLQSIQNIVPVDVLNLKENAPRVFELLNKQKRPVSFLGYVSAFETLCKELEKNSVLRPSLKVKSIITMSEGLNEYTQKKGEEFFRCPVLSRYSNIENGIIAQQTFANRQDFTINRASYFVEIMALDKDEVLPLGESGRIIVTDFYNEAMPLIRYDTGDIGVMEQRDIDGVKQLVLSRLEGRKLDQIYNTKGDLISSYIVYKNMWNYTEIEQYQLIQKEKKEYVMKICIPDKFIREEQLIREFMSYLGMDANFKIEYVNEIPLLSSGKRKKVINEMSIVTK